MRTSRLRSVAACPSVEVARTISDGQADRVEAGQLRARIAELRAALVEAEAQCSRLARESAMRVERLGQIERDRDGWAKRLEDDVSAIARLRLLLRDLAGLD